MSASLVSNITRMRFKYHPPQLIFFAGILFVNALLLGFGVAEENADEAIRVAELRANLENAKTNKAKTFYFPAKTTDADFALVRDVSSLEQVVLVDTCVTDLSPLQELPNLKDIRINRMAKGTVLDLTPLAEVDQLIILKIASVDVLDNGALATLDGLTGLSLHMVDTLDGSDVAKLPNLEKLNINGCNKVTSLQHFAKLEKLTYLSLYRQQLPVKDYEIIRNLKSLKIVQLDFADITDMTCFSGLENLKTIRLGWAKSLTSLKGLETLPALEKLVISEPKVTDWSLIAECPKLTELELDRVQFSDEQLERLKSKLPECRFWIQGRIQPAKSDKSE